MTDIGSILNTPKNHRLYTQKHHCVNSKLEPRFNQCPATRSFSILKPQNKIGPLELKKAKLSANYSR